MGRRQLWRKVSSVPPVTYFKPAGIRLSELEEVNLLVEEAEAIRLKDLEGLEQEECAEKMQISRPTFHRVLESGRGKLADALVNGKAIQIEGGNFGLPQQRFKCGNDGHEWDVPFEVLAGRTPLSCPVCSGTNIQPLPLLPFGLGRGRKFRHGRRR